MNPNNRIEDLPKEENTPPATGGKLFSVWQITVATILGAPIAGTILLARNYQRLGDSAAALKSICFGLAATVIVFAAAFFLPDGFPNFAIPAAYTVGVQMIATQLQGDAIKNSGERASWLVTLVVGIVSLAVIIGIIFGAVAILFSFYQYAEQ